MKISIDYYKPVDEANIFYVYELSLFVYSQCSQRLSCYFFSVKMTYTKWSNTWGVSFLEPQISDSCLLRVVENKTDISFCEPCFISLYPEKSNSYIEYIFKKNMSQLKLYTYTNNSCYLPPRSVFPLNHLLRMIYLGLQFRNNYVAVFTYNWFLPN
jgi:hypothetical protein